jgi:endonuclease/exonuclease/phosphatase family metal-dependent hydrolase
MGRGPTVVVGDFNSATRPPLDKRIDYVFARGLRPQSLAVVGLGPPDKTPSGMWPSDHAGLAATLKLG